MEIIHLPDKGKCLLAIRDIKEGEVIYKSYPDIAVLYTDHVNKCCARCFCSFGNGREFVDWFSCLHCKQFSMCKRCEEDSGDSRMKISWRKYHDTYECKAFMGIPANLRQGDSDYLRFVLRLFSIMEIGFPSYPKPLCEMKNYKSFDDDAKDCFSSLCTNKRLQKPEVIAFVKNFAALFARYTCFPAGMTENKLADVLLRIRMNSLGFPFNEQATLGWSVHTQASLMNHSCAPNCYVANGDIDDFGIMNVVAKKDIAKGEELMISYVDLTKITDDQERLDYLYENYCFVCKCSRCKDISYVKKE